MFSHRLASPASSSDQSPSPSILALDSDHESSPAQPESDEEDISAFISVPYETADDFDLSDSPDVDSEDPGDSEGESSDHRGVLPSTEGSIDSAATANYNRTRGFLADAVSNPEPEPGYIKYVDGQVDPYMMSDDPSQANVDAVSRTAFVTVGGTACFTRLAKEVVSGKFLATMKALGFTHLIVQCGKDHEYIKSIAPASQTESAHGIDITVFDFTNDMEKYMRQCSPGPDDKIGKRGYGVIITHAGAGNVMAALRINTKVVAVVNDSLMDNHQLEFATQMDKDGYVLHGTLGELDEDVKHIEHNAPSQWPPRPPPNSAYAQGGLWAAITDQMPKSKEKQEEQDREDAWALRVD